MRISVTKIIMVLFLFVLPSLNTLGACNLTWLANHTISYWKLEQAAKPYNDTRNNINFPYGDDPTQIAAKIDFGQDFEEGGTDWLNSSRDSNINRTMGNTNGFTYNFWIKPELVDGTETFLSTYYPSTATNGFYFSYLATGYFDLIGYNGTGTNSFRSTSQGTIKVKTGNWQMITITYARNITAIGGRERQDKSYLTPWLNATQITNFATHKGGYFSNQTTVNYALTVGEIGYESNPLDGVLDELSFYDRVLPAECISYLYNAGAPAEEQQFPFTGTPGSSPVVTLLYPVSNHHYGLADPYNGTIIVNANQTVNCTLNDTRFTLSKTNGTAYIFQNNTAITNGNWSIQYRCNSSGTYWTNTTFYLIIDTVKPLAYVNWPPNGSKIWELAHPRFNVSFFDKYLYKANITFINSSGNIRWWIQNGSFTGVNRWWNYSKVDLEPNKTYAEGWYKIRLLATDDHTNTIFSENVEASVTSKDGKTSTTYLLDYADFTQTLPDTITTKVIEDVDRWHFEYETKDEIAPGPTSMFIHSNEPIEYLPNSVWKCHFVIGRGLGKYWYDCEGLTDPKVVKIDSQTYRIDFLMNTPKVVTDSIGGLNNVTVDYDVFLDNSNVSIVWNDSTSTETTITFYFNTSEAANYTYHIGDTCNSSNYSNGTQATHSINHTIYKAGLTVNKTYWINISKMWDNLVGEDQSHVTQGKNSSCFNVSTLSAQILIDATLTVSVGELKGYCNATSLVGKNLSLNYSIFRNGIKVDEDYFRFSGGIWHNVTSGLLLNIVNYTPTLSGNYTFECYATDMSYDRRGNSSSVLIPIINFTFIDELTLGIINFQNVSLNLISEDYNYSRNLTSAAGYINISPPYLGKYRVDYYSEGYYLRSYFFDASDDLIADIDLYLLNSTVGTRIIHHVYNEAGEDASNITVVLMRQFGANFYTVSMTRTNFEGEGVLYVELYDVWYKLAYYTNEGVLLRITDPSPFLDTATTDQVSLSDDSLWSWRNYGSVYTNLSIVNSSGNVFFRYVVVDVKGIMRRACLSVDRMTAGGVYSICSNCSTASTVTLTCQINPLQDGFFKAIGLIDTNSSSSNFAQSLLLWERFKSNALGQQGVFMAAVMVGTLGLMGIGTVTGSIVMLIIAMIGVSMIGFIQYGATGLISVAVIGIIIIYVVKKGGGA